MLPNLASFFDWAANSSPTAIFPRAPQVDQRQAGWNAAALDADRQLADDKLRLDRLFPGLDYESAKKKEREQKAAPVTPAQAPAARQERGNGIGTGWAPATMPAAKRAYPDNGQGAGWGAPIDSESPSSSQSAPDANAAAVGIDKAKTDFMARLDQVYQQLNGLKSPFDTQSEGFQKGLAELTNRTNEANIGAEQRLKSQLAQSGALGQVAGNAALVKQARGAAHDLNSARNTMIAEADVKNDDWQRNKLSALQQVSAGELAGAQGAYGALANITMGYDAQKFNQGIASAQEGRAAELQPYTVQRAAAEAGMSDAQLGEYTAGSAARVESLKQAASRGDLSLAQAKLMAPLEFKQLEQQLSASGIQLNDATWMSQNRVWMSMLAILAGAAPGVGTGIGKKIAGVA